MRATNPTNRCAASQRSWTAERRRSVIAGASTMACRRPTSADTAAHRCKVALGGVPAGASRARCRYSWSRSRSRVPSPRIQLLMVRATTPALCATLATELPPETTVVMASTMTSTPVTFPGRASQGSKRSRCRQSPHRDNATRSDTNESRVSIRRGTRLPVSPRLLPPHDAQRQPARISSPLSTYAEYLLDSMSSTKTTCSWRLRGDQTRRGR